MMTYRIPDKSLAIVLCLLPLILAGAEARAASSTSKADVSREQFETRQQKRFFKADKDGNALVSRDEFLAAHASRDAARVGKRFARMDTNHDGSIDAKEVTAMLDKRFKRLDKDGNGTISASERPVRKPNNG
jgi:Ca2+-binding EF-hand superfamily protein